MIHPGFSKPVVAQYYYRIKTGEELSSEIARKRFWAQINAGNIDDIILLAAMKQIFDEQVKTIHE
jgi:hypothetical protein